MRKVTGVLLAVALLAWAPAALAQGSSSANINAQAVVLNAVSVTAQSDLDFGNVIPGTNKAVAITSASAGRWIVQGSGGAEVGLSFPALPISLSDGASNTLPLVFTPTDAAYNPVLNPGGAQTFDPSTGTSANIGASPAELYVWIGGTVVPAPAQASGTYTGTITMQATYTGN